MTRPGMMGMLVVVCALTATAAAQENPEAPAAEAPAEVEDELPPHQVGPATVDLGHGVEIFLPEGKLLFEANELRPMMEKFGENPEGVIAMIWPSNFVMLGHMSRCSAFTCANSSNARPMNS